MKRMLPALFLAASLALSWLAAGSVYTLSQSEKALVIRLGSPVGVVERPGLHLRTPLVDSVVVYDTRLLALESRPEQIILGDQKRVEVQTYARYRITDPLAYYRSSRTVEQGKSQLSQVVSSATRRELGRVKLSALLSDERTAVMGTILGSVAERARLLGVEMVDVRLRRADLPAETSQAIYERMKSERQRQAKELRAQGFEWAQQIQAQADRERTTIMAQATKRSRILRGEGDATANRLYAAASNEAPDFFTFYRSLQSYRQALAEAQPTLVLSPDARFLELLKAGPQTGGHRD